MALRRPSLQALVLLLALTGPAISRESALKPHESPPTNVRITKIKDVLYVTLDVKGTRLKKLFLNASTAGIRIRGASEEFPVSGFITRYPREEGDRLLLLEVAPDSTASSPQAWVSHAGIKLIRKSTVKVMRDNLLSRFRGTRMLQDGVHLEMAFTVPAGTKAGEVESVRVLNLAPIRVRR